LPSGDTFVRTPTEQQDQIIDDPCHLLLRHLTAIVEPHWDEGCEFHWSIEAPAPATAQIFLRYCTTSTAKK
jgi:hypothetical protein